MITVCTPTIPARAGLLARAVASAAAQTVPPYAINIAVDLAREGHGRTRTRAVEAAVTEWVAFLDDDDELYPTHLERLTACQVVTGADVVYPWFDVIGGADPFPEHEGQPWSESVVFPVTVLVRRSTLLDVGGFSGYEAGWESGHDWATWRRVIASGAKIAHLPERTWAWHHDTGNTSGLVDGAETGWRPGVV